MQSHVFAVVVSLVIKIGINLIVALLCKTRHVIEQITETLYLPAVDMSASVDDAKNCQLKN